MSVTQTGLGCHYQAHGALGGLWYHRETCKELDHHILSHKDKIYVFFKMSDRVSIKP